MTGRTYIGPFESDYILDRCSKYRSSNASDNSRSNVEGAPKLEEEKVKSSRVFTKGNPLNVEQLVQRIKQLSGIYVPVIFNGMLYFLPWSDKDVATAKEKAMSKEMVTTARSSSSTTLTTAQLANSGTTLADIKFRLKQIEKLVGRRKMVEATLRGAREQAVVSPQTSNHTPIKQIPEAASSSGSTSSLCPATSSSSKVDMSELKSALVRVNAIQQQEDISADSSLRKNQSSTKTASSPESWLQELQHELEQLQKGVALKRREDASPTSGTSSSSNEDIPTAKSNSSLSPALEELRRELISGEKLSSEGIRLAKDEEEYYFSKAIESPSFTDLRTAIEKRSETNAANLPDL